MKLGWEATGSGVMCEGSLTVDLVSKLDNLAIIWKEDCNNSVLIIIF